MINQHEMVLEKLHDIYKSKNQDYGNSFGETFDELGPISAVTRISDKYKRMVQLSVHGDRQVDDETLEDTLIDLANYAIMYYMELQRSVDFFDRVDFLDIVETSPGRLYGEYITTTSEPNDIDTFLEIIRDKFDLVSLNDVYEEYSKHQIVKNKEVLSRTAFQSGLGLPLENHFVSVHKVEGWLPGDLEKHLIKKANIAEHESSEPFVEPVVEIGLDYNEEQLMKDANGVDDVPYDLNKHALDTRRILMESMNDTIQSSCE